MKTTAKSGKNQNVSPKASQAAAKTVQKASAKGTAAKTSQKTTEASSRSGVSSNKKAESAELLGLPLTTWVGRTQKAKGEDLRAGRRGFLFLFSSKDLKILKSVLNSHLSKWQMDLLSQDEGEAVHFDGSQGPVWIFRCNSPSARQGLSIETTLEKLSYAKYRDAAGAIVPQLTSFNLERLIVTFVGVGKEEQKGTFVGLEMASYSYAENRPESRKARKKLPAIVCTTSSEAKGGTPELNEREIRDCARLALSVNIARHFVNLPAGQLDTKSFAECIEDLFAGSSETTVEVWEGRRLKEERMNLLLAVGGAAHEGPRFVHIRYRPHGVNANVRPVAIVGKGVTFDTGGLDVKPSSAMRWMKKDMGGAAAAVAIAKWADMAELQMPLDVYVSLAENAIGPGAFRPGDVITARNGLTVEIHNTDAEGRLVLADALDVAVSQEGNDAPAQIINIATLTGAIKIGLGADVAGLFSNNDELAQGLFESGLAKGDLNWRMPLFQPYKNLLRSTFADHANSSDGFAGAITAALFLELFVKGVPWAHLDVYAWKDSASGAWSEAGGNGQPVQAIAEYLLRLSGQSED